MPQATRTRGHQDRTVHPVDHTLEGMRQGLAPGSVPVPPVSRVGVRDFFFRSRRREPRGAAERAVPSSTLPGTGRHRV